jgi:hypothetical protein
MRSFITCMEDEMGRECSTHGENRNAYRILVGKLEDLDVGGRIISEWILER